MLPVAKGLIPLRLATQNRVMKAVIDKCRTEKHFFKNFLLILKHTYIQHMHIQTYIQHMHIQTYIVTYTYDTHLYIYVQKTSYLLARKYKFLIGKILKVIIAVKN